MKLPAKKILFAAGSFVLFCSWLIDNYLQKKSDDELAFQRSCISEMHSSRIMSIVSKFAYEYYRDKYMEMPPDDTASFYNLLYFSADHALNYAWEHSAIINAFSSIDPSWHNYQDSIGYGYEETIRTLHKEKNIDSIESVIYAMDSVLSVKDLYVQYDRAYEFRKILTRSEKTRKLFLFYYILGSLLIAIAYFLPKPTENLTGHSNNYRKRKISRFSAGRRKPRHPMT